MSNDTIVTRDHKIPSYPNAQQPSVATSVIEDTERCTPSSPTLATESAQKDAAGNISSIARPRASANKVNLMDSPWQLLPPPSGKTKQTIAKKSLKMDSVDIGSDPNLSSPASSDGHIDSLVNINEACATDKSPPIKHDFFKNDRLKVKKKKEKKDKDGYFRNLSKEKSRSIDSLRSDISESSMFEWKRQSIRRDSRPR